jgi:uncharacterized protein YjiS (DUF1127 family)
MHAHSRDPARAAALAAPPSWSAALARLAAGLAASGTVRFLAALAADWAAARRVRRTARELSAWDDRMLRDIGLDRMEIELAVRGAKRPFAPSPYRWEPDCDPAARRRLDHMQ